MLTDIQAAIKEREEGIAHHYRYTRFERCCWLIFFEYRDKYEPLPRSIPYLKGFHAICLWLRKEVVEAVVEQEAGSVQWKLLKTCIPSEHHSRILQLDAELDVLIIRCEEDMETLEQDDVDGFPHAN